jgi:hypothetical protein
MDRTGYLNALYPQSLREFGEIIELPASQGWILRRPIPGTAEFDGMGCYPIFVCESWPALGQDLDLIGDQLVCLSLVTDPFGQYTQSDLLKYFRDIARPYKEHFVIDLQQQPENYVASHHQRNVQKALKAVHVEVCTEPINYLDEWVALYGQLVERHHITGIARFSRDAFARQLSVPGITAFRAHMDGTTIGMLLWYVQGNVGYYHLGAYNPDGYRLNASFALFWTLLGHFTKAGLQWLSLGAGAGVQGDQNDGLSRFKRGWSTGQRMAYFCGRIFDHKKYREIVQRKQIPPTDFFPAYRLAELQSRSK